MPTLGPWVGMGQRVQLGPVSLVVGAPRLARASVVGPPGTALGWVVGGLVAHADGVDEGAVDLGLAPGVAFGLVHLRGRDDAAVPFCVPRSSVRLRGGAPSRTGVAVPLLELGDVVTVAAVSVARPSSSAPGTWDEGQQRALVRALA